jgi:hypothetical protein
MGVNPTGYPMPGAFMTDIDFSPLTRLGERISDTMRRNREEEEASQIIAQLYGRGQQQTPLAAAPRAGGGAVAQPQAPQQPRMTARELTPPPLATPNARVAGVFGQFPNAPSAPMATAGAPVSSPFDTAQWPQGPVGAPGSVQSASAPVASPFDAAQWPQGPVGAPGTVQSASAPVASPFDDAQWPQGPNGARPSLATPLETASPAAPAPGPTAFAAPEAAPDPMAAYRRATSSIESGGPEGNYRAVGPQTKYGRAIGRYQVLASNVPEWSEKYFGERLTPTEFLNNPAAQDAVYRGKFGEYVQKYGPEGAARAWFAGERNMNNMNASDGHKTVRAYAQDFTNALPSEITAGSSRPTPTEQQPTQAMAFDRGVENLSTPGAPASAADISPQEMAAMYKNPLTRPLAAALLQKQISPDVYDFKVEGTNIVRYNKRDGTYSVQQLPEKLMHVKDDEKIFDPNTRTYVGGQGPSDNERYGKLQPGERWKDPNNRALGSEPIPGGQHAKIGDEIAARVGLAKSFMSSLPEIRRRIDRGDVGIDNGIENHGQAIAGVGTPGETKRMMDAGAESLIRMLTGAGMNKEEAVQNAEQYRLRAKDTAFTIKSKMDALERHLLHIGDALGKGRGGGNLLETPPMPTMDRAALERELRKRGALPAQ